MRPPSRPWPALLPLVLAACGPAPAPVSPPFAVEITVAPGEAPPPPPSPTAAPAGPAAPEVEVLAAPAPVGCELTGKRLFTPFEPGPSLCLAAAGPCFGTVAAGDDPLKLTATYFEGSAREAGVHVAVERGPLTVRGIVRTAQLRLYPRLLFTIGSPRATGDFVVPVSRVLAVEEAGHGRVTVGIRLEEGVQVEGSEVRTERRCDELSLEPNRLSEETARRFVAGKPAAAPARGGHDTLPPGKDTPLLATPGQPPVAMLHPGENDAADVDVLERRGRDARIFWMRDGYAVFGWVPAGVLKRSSNGGVFGVLGGVPGGVAGGASPRTFTCRADVPLFVEMLSRRVEVGRLRKDARLQVTGRRSGFVAVGVVAAPVELARDAVWLVREGDFDSACGSP